MILPYVWCFLKHGQFYLKSDCLQMYASVSMVCAVTLWQANLGVSLIFVISHWCIILCWIILDFGSSSTHTIHNSCSLVPPTILLRITMYCKRNLMDRKPSHCVSALEQSSSSFMTSREKLLENTLNSEEPTQCTEFWIRNPNYEQGSLLTLQLALYVPSGVFEQGERRSLPAYGLFWTVWLLWDIWIPYKLPCRHIQNMFTLRGHTTFTCRYGLGLRNL